MNQSPPPPPSPQNLRAGTKKNCPTENQAIRNVYAYPLLPQPPNLLAYAISSISMVTLSHRPQIAQRT